MFIPRYWSEARHRERYPDNRQITIRRFGWSGTSQEEADLHARRRVEEALAVLRERGSDALRDFTRRERVVAYAGADGLPIREEIVYEYPDADVVVTRNSYGALCLNTTAAMFVDIDEPGSRAGLFGCLGGTAGFVLGILLAVVLRWGWGWPLAAIASAFVVGWAASAVARVLESRDPRRLDLLAWALQRTREWCREFPEWRVMAYETPAGVRLLPVHDAFDAGDDASFEFMAFVQADPLYQRMCRLQKCFRARVSPKPWRAGMQERFCAGGTWPVRDPAKLAKRDAWVRRYEQHAAGYASCRLAETVGDGRPSAAVEQVRQLHDKMCRAESGLGLA